MRGHSTPGVATFVYNGVTLSEFEYAGTDART